MSGSEIMVDPDLGTVVLNDTDVSTDAVFSALSEQHPELAALTRWGQQITGGARIPGNGGGCGFPSSVFGNPGRTDD